MHQLLAGRQTDQKQPTLTWSCWHIKQALQCYTTRSKGKLEGINPFVTFFYIMHAFVSIFFFFFFGEEVGWGGKKTYAVLCYNEFCCNIVSRYDKQIRYASRADTRKRVKGRFVKSSEIPGVGSNS